MTRGDCCDAPGSVAKTQNTNARKGRSGLGGIQKGSWACEAEYLNMS
jgi:hypothetical protein